MYIEYQEDYPDGTCKTKDKYKNKLKGLWPK